MSSDELRGQSRKIDTEGGVYQEGGQSQRVNVHVGDGPEAQRDPQRPGDLGELIKAIVAGNGGVSLTRISELKKQFPDFAEDIDGAIQGAVINHNVLIDKRLNRVERKVNVLFVLLCFGVGGIMVLLIMELAQGGAI
jgi:hypothetical protein